MKKRVLSILAALLLTFSVIAPVSAACPAGGTTSPRSCRNAPCPGSGCAALLSRLKNFGCSSCPSPFAACPNCGICGGSGAAAKTPSAQTPAADASGKLPSGGEGQSASGVLAAEREVVALVNRQRAANGLSPLTLSEKLCSGARMKSQDMRDKGYFNHTSPTYGSPFAMMASLGIAYRAAGENIAMGYPTAEAVVNAWMSSAGHRANILSGSYTSIGVGYIADGNYWTQWFIG